MIKNQKGFGVIEVVVVLGLSAIIITSIGNLLNSLYKINKAAELRTRAFSYAQESLEIINDKRNDLFACQCAVAGCSTCVRPSDGQSCTPFSGYDSCWTAYPAGSDLIGIETFRLYKSGSNWVLEALSPDPSSAVIDLDPTFSRKITIKNAFRDINGDIASSGTVDPNTKIITAKVWWKQRDDQHQVDLSTILTAWQNL
ncbi:MAG: hypothetical protein A3J62_03575 [Candidatus Buchananbacteria bacterium RIFCSPHIGHO2_02_FULL_38_8]|uniref:Uncharacterized protein n=2 Tax=Candidatus Buchananiibacteriota TaxID=1817903 RepID=A0A1G1Y1K9_9BACT|nr:MAG: hypothetical protein A2731_03235 [Candidatus Buchananbacteria bacterium RIFCSPHIGHO2_01_FULL_39_8]OGY47241.1 MAG: hypothetical protein A3J62_03575 [Candidatus Buchananbacteria bacterium RIFCSPHIGHO2_02_FULL_38_8]